MNGLWGWAMDAILRSVQEPLELLSNDFETELPGATHAATTNGAEVYVPAGSGAREIEMWKRHTLRCPCQLVSVCGIRQWRVVIRIGRISSVIKVSTS